MAKRKKSKKSKMKVKKWLNLVAPFVVGYLFGKSKQA